MPSPVFINKRYSQAAKRLKPVTFDRCDVALMRLRAGRCEVGDKLGNFLFLFCRRGRCRFLFRRDSFHAAL